MGRISPGPTRWPPGAEEHLVSEISNLKPQTHFSGYVQSYASIATPLIDMLKNLPQHKNGKKIGLMRNASANKPFLKFERAMTDFVPLQLANWDKDFVLFFLRLIVTLRI